MRAEIGEHIASALESAGTADVDQPDVERRAVASLGDARGANRQYRRVLLTDGEDNLLRSLTSWWSSWGWLVMGIPSLALSMAMRSSPMIYISVSVLFEGVSRRFPLHSIRVGLIMRIVRWSVTTSCLTMWIVSTGAGIGNVAMGVYIAVVIVHREYKFSVLRRKVPVEQWPRWLWV